MREAKRTKHHQHQELPHWHYYGPPLPYFYWPRYEPAVAPQPVVEPEPVVRQKWDVVFRPGHKKYHGSEQFKLFIKNHVYQTRANIGETREVLEQVLQLWWNKFPQSRFLCIIADSESEGEKSSSTETYSVMSNHALIHKWIGSMINWYKIQWRKEEAKRESKGSSTDQCANGKSPLQQHQPDHSQQRINRLISLLTASTKINAKNSHEVAETPT